MYTIFICFLSPPWTDRQCGTAIVKDLWWDKKWLVPFGFWSLECYTRVTASSINLTLSASLLSTSISQSGIHVLWPVHITWRYQYTTLYPRIYPSKHAFVVTWLSQPHRNIYAITLQLAELSHIQGKALATIYLIRHIHEAEFVFMNPLVTYSRVGSRGPHAPHWYIFLTYFFGILKVSSKRILMFPTRNIVPRVRLVAILVAILDFRQISIIGITFELDDIQRQTTPFFCVILAWGIDWEGYFHDFNKVDTLKLEK